MRVLGLCTWNIHAGIGTDRRLDPDRIATVLQEIDSDIVALQEVEHHRVDGRELPDYLAYHGGYRVHLGPTLLRFKRPYGNVLLSRLPVSNLRRLDLSVAGREPRGALDVDIRTGNARLRIVNTHLGVLPGERREQVKRLLTHLEAVSAADVTLLTGDINEWFIWGRPVRWLNRHFSPAPAPCSFPSFRPLLALDRIWITPREHLLSTRVHVSATARRASDHLPVCATFSLP